jgi:hypothetical protein
MFLWWNLTTMYNALYDCYVYFKTKIILQIIMKCRCQLSLLTEMSTRNLPGGKGQLAGEADNLTTICEPIVLYCEYVWCFQLMLMKPLMINMNMIS